MSCPEHSTAEETLTAAVGLRAQVVLDRVPAAVEDQHDAVHQLRTAVRRLRSLLAVFRSHFLAEEVTDLRHRLSTLGDVLGEPRDLEVAAELAGSVLEELRAGRDDEPVAEVSATLFDAVLEDRATAHATFVAWWEDHGEELTRVLEGWTEDAPVDPALTEEAAKPFLKDAVRSEVARARTMADRLEVGLLEGPDDRTLADAHRLRKAGRRLRYIAEAFTQPPAEVLGKKARRAGKRGSRLQTVLGDHRDALLLGGRARRLAVEASTPGAADDFRAFAAVAEARASSALADLPQAMTKLRSAALPTD